MDGSTRINDIVRYKGEDGLYIVTDINDSRFNANGGWVFTMTLQRVGGGGGRYDVSADNVDTVMTASWYNANRKTPQDLPDPRLRKF